MTIVNAIEYSTSGVTDPLARHFNRYFELCILGGEGGSGDSARLRAVVEQTVEAKMMKMARKLNYLTSVRLLHSVAGAGAGAGAEREEQEQEQGPGTGGWVNMAAAFKLELWVWLREERGRWGLGTPKPRAGWVCEPVPETRSLGVGRS